MRRRPTASELERAAAARPAPRPPPEPARGEALAMLVRRGLRPRPARPDVPFPDGLANADAVAARLRHYAFRLFLRGAILARGPFRPAAATRYLSAEQAVAMAEELVRLGLARRAGAGRYRLCRPARNFGGTLEWWIARELHDRLALDVATGVRSGSPGVGGDLDVVAAAEGKLLYVELKSSPPKHVTRAEVAAFVRRVRALRPDLSVLAVDTALRLSDKVLPLLAAEVGAGPSGRPEPVDPPAPRLLLRDCWEVAPRLYLVGARQDLAENLCLAIVDGLRRLAPAPP